MIKKSIRLLGTSKKEKRLEKDMWRLTDSEFTYQFLLEDDNSKQLMERVLLCKPYSPLAIIYVRGKGSIQYINNNIRLIEAQASHYLSKELGLKRYKDEDLVLANFYPDKRHRWIPEDRWCGLGSPKCSECWEEGAILGFFTPAKVTGYAFDTERKSRSIRRFDNSKIPGLIEEVKKTLLEYEVMEYGEEV